MRLSIHRRTRAAGNPKLWHTIDCWFGPMPKGAGNAPCGTLAMEYINRRD